VGKGKRGERRPEGSKSGRERIGVLGIWRHICLCFKGEEENGGFGFECEKVTLTIFLYRKYTAE
jgi:hypothetical protein